MSRRLKTKLPIARKLLAPTPYDAKEVARLFSTDKERQRHYYDKRASNDLPVLLPGDPVTMMPAPGSNQWLPATVVSHHNSPRSYVVEYNNRKYHRNRQHLRMSTIEGLGKFTRSGVTTQRQVEGPSTPRQRVPATQPKQQGTVGQTPKDRPSQSREQGAPELTRSASPVAVRATPAKPKEPDSAGSPGGKVLRSGRVSRPPKRLDL